MKTFKSVITTIVLIFSISTFAGGIQPASVEIIFDDEGNFYAGGDMWTARSSDNDVEMIGCSVKKHSAHGNDWGFCQAVNSDDEYVVCFTQDEKMLEAIYAISDASYISFNGKGYEPWEEGAGEGECTRISISSQSMYLPLVTTE